jgi:hypothetical protein
MPRADVARLSRDPGCMATPLCEGARFSYKRGMRILLPFVCALAWTLGCSHGTLPNGSDLGASSDMARPKDLATAEDLARRSDLAGCIMAHEQCTQSDTCCSGYCAFPISRPPGEPEPREGGPGFCVPVP